jgi:thiol-disulfide isomerase/thioredoxin
MKNSAISTFSHLSINNNNIQPMSITNTTNDDNILPDFPLTCLSSAEFKSTSDVFKGRNTVIDFWTTKCTRCPQALDELNSLAQQSKYSNVTFTSIVLDECDGARNIIETPNDAPRWQNIQHYYMDVKFKEEAKDKLGFRQVPFYVVMDDKGVIVQKGSKRDIDFGVIPGVEKEEEEEKVEEKECEEERVFCMDEDF